MQYVHIICDVSVACDEIKISIKPRQAAPNPKDDEGGHDPAGYRREACRHDGKDLGASEVLQQWTNDHRGLDL